MSDTDGSLDPHHNLRWKHRGVSTGGGGGRRDGGEAGSQRETYRPPFYLGQSVSAYLGWQKTD